MVILYYRIIFYESFFHLKYYSQLKFQRSCFVLNEEGMGFADIGRLVERNIYTLIRCEERLTELGTIVEEALVT